MDTAELEQYDREIADIRAQSDVPCWLLAMAEADWAAENIFILMERLAYP